MVEWIVESLQVEDTSASLRTFYVNVGPRLQDEPSQLDLTRPKKEGYARTTYVFSNERTQSGVVGVLSS